MFKRKFGFQIAMKDSFANSYPSPSCHVTNKAGQQIQKNFYQELVQKLDEIHPGISANVQ